MNKVFHSMLLFVALFASAGMAQSIRQITWEQLAMKLAPDENPFARLLPEQLEALVEVAAIRDRKSRGVILTAEEVNNERAAAERLQQHKIDVDALLARREEVARRQIALASAVNKALDGQNVRLPGYVLPLEMSDKGVTEFLLVPYVGACIHTPPPPRNQIVHVKASKPIAIKGSFDAVWITGRMSTSGSVRSVYMTDGAADVDVGYSMAAASVEPYK